MQEISETIGSIITESEQVGVIVKADTLGSLEALRKQIQLDIQNANFTLLTLSKV